MGLRQSVRLGWAFTDVKTDKHGELIDPRFVDYVQNRDLWYAFWYSEQEYTVGSFADWAWQKYFKGVDTTDLPVDLRHAWGHIMLSRNNPYGPSSEIARTPLGDLVYHDSDHGLGTVFIVNAGLHSSNYRHDNLIDSYTASAFLQNPGRQATELPTGIWPDDFFYVDERTWTVHTLDEIRKAMLYPFPGDALRFCRKKGKLKKTEAEVVDRVVDSMGFSSRKELGQTVHSVPGPWMKLFMEYTGILVDPMHYLQMHPVLYHYWE